MVLEVDHFFYDRADLVFKSRMKRAALTVFPFYEYHLYWRDALKKSKREPYKGYKYRSEVRGYTGDKRLEPTDEVYEMHPRFRKSFDDIYALCTQHGSQLALVELPSKIFWSYSRHNCIQSIADDSGLPFVDLNTDDAAAQMAFDWSTDTCDGGDHLNFRGARKVSGYLGRWLHNTFDLPDRRGEPEYADWDEDLATYKSDSATWGV